MYCVRVRAFIFACVCAHVRARVCSCVRVRARAYIQIYMCTSVAFLPRDIFSGCRPSTPPPPVYIGGHAFPRVCVFAVRVPIRAGTRFFRPGLSPALPIAEARCGM